MRIGAISFQPYVYNVNAISPASMNRLSGISDNVLDKKTDFSGLVENENPLKKGQTLNFQDMLKMQMQRGRSNAARVMKPEQETQEEADAAQVTERKVQEETDTAQAAEQTQDAAAMSDREGSVSNFRMQQAIDAYQMFMTA